MALETPLWRTLTVFRAAALGYAALLMVGNFQHYARPLGGWLVVALMTGWTAVASWAYATPSRRGWTLLWLDLAVTALCLLATRWVVQPEGVALGSPTLPMAWAAAPVLAWAIFGGRWWGATAALLMGAADIVVRAGLSLGTMNGVVLMFFAGVLVGHVARLAGRAQAQLRRAVEVQTATRERERLARGIHDSVLQVLSLVQRRGAEIGGETAELGRLAGDQEAILRTLLATGSGLAAPTGVAATGVAPTGARAPTGVTPTGVTPTAVTPTAVTGSHVDLRTALDQLTSTRVTLAAPATAVLLPAPVVTEIEAAVASALDNVRRHAGDGARAWVLVEEEPGSVTVTVRDNGVGIPAGGLAAARAAGRLGVAQSIEGRLRELGGEAVITSVPNQGTEVELSVPRPAEQRSARRAAADPPIGSTRRAAVDPPSSGRPADRVDPPIGSRNGRRGTGDGGR